MALPLGLDQAQRDTQWKSQLDPVLSNPLNNIKILKNVALVNGTTILNHKLGSTMKGWFIVDQDASASVYKPSTAPFNALTLTLVSNAAVNVNLAVF